MLNSQLYHLCGYHEITTPLHLIATITEDKKTKIIIE